MLKDTERMMHDRGKKVLLLNDLKTKKYKPIIKSNQFIMFLIIPENSSQNLVKKKVEGIRKEYANRITPEKDRDKLQLAMVK